MPTLHQEYAIPGYIRTSKPDKHPRSVGAQNEVVMMLRITRYGTDARKGRDVVTSWSVHAYIPAFLRPPEAQIRPPST